MIRALETTPLLSEEEAEVVARANSTLLLEEEPCPICGGTDKHWTYAKSNKLIRIQCPECKYKWPLPKTQ